MNETNKDRWQDVLEVVVAVERGARQMMIIVEELRWRFERKMKQKVLNN